MKKATFKALIAFYVLSVTCCTNFIESYSQTAYRRGVKEANEELNNGILAVESYGLLAPWSGDYRRILKSRYGIEDRVVAGCCVDGENIGHAEGFNSVMNRAIKQRYRKDVFAEAAAEARAGYTKKSG